MGLGFHRYSKKASLGRKFFAREEFGFPPLTEREPHRAVMTRPRERKIYLRQNPSWAGREGAGQGGCGLWRYTTAVAEISLVAQFASKLIGTAVVGFYYGTASGV